MNAAVELDRILGAGRRCFVTKLSAAEDWGALDDAIASASARGDCWTANVLAAGLIFARRCRRGGPVCAACWCLLSPAKLAGIYLLCAARQHPDEFLPVGFCRECAAAGAPAVDALAMAALGDLLGRDLHEIFTSPAGRA